MAKHRHDRFRALFTRGRDIRHPGLEEASSTAGSVDPDCRMMVREQYDEHAAEMKRPASRSRQGEGLAWCVTQRGALIVQSMGGGGRSSERVLKSSRTCEMSPASVSPLMSTSVSGRKPLVPLSTVFQPIKPPCVGG